MRGITEIPGGIPRQEAYLQLSSTSEFKEMEEYSNTFLAMNADILDDYANRWVADPLHQWSRLWEYPYCMARAQRLVRQPGGPDLRILDAGSGATFMPYYLAEKLSGVQVYCLDADESLVRVHREIATRASTTSVHFNWGDLAGSAYESNSFDFIYCVSVLEHTSNYDTILDEFARLLKPGGLCVITFDISLDGHGEIPPAEADLLVKLLCRRFAAVDFVASAMTDTADASDMVTPAYAEATGLAAIPWRHSLPKRLLLRGARLLKGRVYPPPFTFFCGTVQQHQQPQCEAGRRSDQLESDAPDSPRVPAT